VKPTRLALHFLFALGLLCYTFWFALELLVPAEKITRHTTTRKLTITSIAILVLQLIYGALMAGHKAATAAPTWPDINGHIVPPNMMGNNDGLLNLIDNKITIHFIHRGLAYLLLVLVILLSYRLYRIHGSSLVQKTRWWPLFLVLLQVLLGILAVLSSLAIIPNRWGEFEWMAQLHQGVAMLLLLSLVWILYIIRNSRQGNAI
jgi:cytochrome c oxidase assembly protein subunit 15